MNTHAILRLPLVPPTRPYRATPSLAVALFLFLALLAGGAQASEGVFLLGNDAQQLGRAGSGVASPRSAYWAYMNPGSMIDLDSRFDTSLFNVFAKVEAKPRGILGNRLDGKLEGGGMYNILSGCGIYSLKEYGRIGGGLYVPSGTGVEYPHSRNIMTRLLQGNHDRRLMYQHFRLVVSYAYELPYGIGVGASLQSSLTRFRTDHLTLNFRPTEGNNEYDDAYGIGYGLGVYKAWERFSLGLNYTSRHYTQKLDKYKDLLKYSLDTPQIVQVGFGVKPWKPLELTMDLKYLNWKGVPSYGNKLLKGGFNWHDQLVVKAGAEWTINKQWRLMAGFSHGNTPIDKDHVFLSTLVPVTCEDHLTLGGTYALSEHQEVHLVGVYGFKKTLKDSGHGDLLSRLGGGSELSSSGIDFAIGYSYKF